MSAFLCLGCYDDGKGCPSCTPTSPEVPALLAALAAVAVGLALAAVSCRGTWRWWL